MCLLYGSITEAWQGRTYLVSQHIHMCFLQCSAFSWSVANCGIPSHPLDSYSPKKVQITPFAWERRSTGNLLGASLPIHVGGMSTSMPVPDFAHLVCINLPHVSQCYFTLDRLHVHSWDAGEVLSESIKSCPIGICWSSPYSISC